MKIKLTEKEVILKHWHYGYLSVKMIHKLYQCGYGVEMRNIIYKQHIDTLKRGWWGGR